MSSTPTEAVAGPSPAGAVVAGAGAPRPAKALLFAVTATGVSVNTSVAPVLPELIEDFGVATSAVGLVLAASTVPGIAAAPVLGTLADRFGRRAVLVPSLVLFAVAGGLTALAPAFEVLMALRVLQGIGSVGLMNLALVLISDHWSGAERGKVLGQNSAVLAVALAISPVVGGVAAELSGTWRAAFLPFALSLVLAVAAWRGLRAGAPPDVAARGRGTAVAALRHGPVVRALGTGFVVFVLMYAALFTILPVYADDVLGLSPGIRSLLVAIPALTTSLAAVAVGRLTGRFGHHAVVVVGTVVFTVAFLTIGLVPALPALAIGLLLFGLAQGLTLPALQDQLATSGDAATRGTIFSLWASGIRAGQSVGPVLAGLALAAARPSTAFLMAAGVAAALLVWRVLMRRG